MRPAPVTWQRDASAAFTIVPVGLRVSGRSVLVVGAGRIAARKTAVYLGHGAVVTVVAPSQSEAMNNLAVHTRHRRPFQPEDLDGVWLVVTATGIPAVDDLVYREAERRKIWCNAADDPAHCSVILPAVSRKGDITIAVSTNGTSPAVAAWLGRRVDRLLDDATLEVASIAARVRAVVRSQGIPTEVPAWQQILDGQALDLVASGRGHELERTLYNAVAESGRQT